MPSKKEIELSKELPTAMVINLGLRSWRVFSERNTESKVIAMGNSRNNAIANALQYLKKEKMKKILKIGDSVFHPCSIDIIEHKVISIREFENFNHYVLKAVRSVGACGRLEVIIDEHKGNLRFVELIDEENLPYASGLQDFVEGNYYRTLLEARIEYYSKQETLAWTNMDHKERLFKEAKARYEQVKLLVKTYKEEHKQNIENNGTK